MTKLPKRACRSIDSPQEMCGEVETRRIGSSIL